MYKKKKWDLVVNPRDSGVPLSGHKEPVMMQQQATVELLRFTRSAFICAQLTGWLHGNAPTNHSSRGNCPYEATS